MGLVVRDQMYSTYRGETFVFDSRWNNKFKLTAVSKGARTWTKAGRVVVEEAIFDSWIG